MKRDILCVECGERSKSMFPEGVDQNGEGIKHVLGRMRLGQPPGPLLILNMATGERREEIKPTCVCDNCNVAVMIGDRCYARSMWIEGRVPYYEWEEEYIEPDSTVPPLPS